MSPRFTTRVHCCFAPRCCVAAWQVRRVCRCNLTWPARGDGQRIRSGLGGAAFGSAAPLVLACGPYGSRTAHMAYQLSAADQRALDACMAAQRSCAQENCGRPCLAERRAIAELCAANVSESPRHKGSIWCDVKPAFQGDLSKRYQYRYQSNSLKNHTCSSSHRLARAL